MKIKRKRFNKLYKKFQNLKTLTPNKKILNKKPSFNEKPLFPFGTTCIRLVSFTITIGIAKKSLANIFGDLLIAPIYN